MPGRYRAALLFLSVSGVHLPACGHTLPANGRRLLLPFLSPCQLSYTDPVLEKSGLYGGLFPGCYTALSSVCCRSSRLLKPIRKGCSGGGRRCCQQSESQSFPHKKNVG